MLTVQFLFAASPTVVIAYEDILKRPGIFGPNPWLTTEEIDRILDTICERLFRLCHGSDFGRS
jgi:hypothetical protein